MMASSFGSFLEAAAAKAGAGETTAREDRSADARGVAAAAERSAPRREQRAGPRSPGSAVALAWEAVSAALAATTATTTRAFFAAAVALGPNSGQEIIAVLRVHESILGGGGGFLELGREGDWGSIRISIEAREFVDAPFFIFRSRVEPKERERERKRNNFLSNVMESSMRLSPSKTIARPAEAAACVRRLVEDDVSWKEETEKEKR